MSNIKRRLEEWVKKSSTSKLVGCSLSMWGIFLFLVIFMPDSNIGTTMIRILFSLSMLSFGVGGIPIILRKEFPFQILKLFPLFERLAKVEAVLFGWIILLTGIVSSLIMVGTFFQ